MMSYCVKRITDRLSKHECIKTFVLPHSLSSKSPVTKNHFGKLITPSLNIFQNALYAFTKRMYFYVFSQQAIKVSFKVCILKQYF